MTITPEALERLPDTLDGHWTSAAGREMAVRYANEPRSALGKADVPDFALANAVFMADRGDLDLIVWQTAAKERIRWLSVQLALALATLEASQAENVRLRAALTMMLDGNDEYSDICDLARQALSTSGEGS